MMPSKNNENIDDLFYDFFKEEIQGKGMQWDDRPIDGNPFDNPNHQKKDVARNIIPEDNSNPFEWIEKKQPLESKPTLPNQNLPITPRPVANNNFENNPSNFQKNEKPPLQEEWTPSSFPDKPQGNYDYEIPTRSDEVDEILSFIPHWLIRWGTTLFFLLIVGIIVMSYFIKYPDVVEGVITLTSDDPPAEVVSKSSGALKIFVEDQEAIQQNDVIALLKNNANYKHIKALKNELWRFKKAADRGSFVKVKEYYKVGSLQQAYSQFNLALGEKSRISRSSMNDLQRKQNIERQVRQLKKSAAEQQQSIQILEKEYLEGKKILEERYARLLRMGSISKNQYENKQSEVNQQLTQYQNAKVSYNENQNRILTLQSQGQELQFDQSDKKYNNESTIMDAYYTLLNQINAWEEQYLLKAPIDGTINYLQFVKNNMHVKPEQHLASVLPFSNTADSLSSPIIGELFITSTGSGKVEIGQTVNIELNDFMKKEFGMVKGEVASISNVSTNIDSPKGESSMYKIDVVLPDGLTTNYEKPIKFKYNMQGKAEVITKDVRLLERFFSEIRNAIEN